MVICSLDLPIVFCVCLFVCLFFFFLDIPPVVSSVDCRFVSTLVVGLVCRSLMLVGLYAARWFVDRLSCLSVGMLVGWYVGWLVCWSFRMLVGWYIYMYLCLLVCMLVGYNRLFVGSVFYCILFIACIIVNSPNLWYLFLNNVLCAIFNIQLLIYIFDVNFNLLFCIL